MSTPVPPRPSYGSPENWERAVVPIVGRVMAWCQKTQALRAADDARLVRELCAALDGDAYHWAKTLDDQHRWPVNQELVKILCDVSLTMAHDEMVREWVRRYEIKVPFSKGDRVSTAQYKAATVASVLHGVAVICIQPDGEEEKWRDQPLGGHCVYFEQVVPIVGTIGTEAPA